MRNLHETDVEQALVADVEAVGLTVLKLTPRGRRGYPDRLVLVPGGRPLFIELKRAGEEPRALQAHRHAELRALGYDVAVADAYGAAVRAVAGALDAAGWPKVRDALLTRTRRRHPSF